MTNQKCPLCDEPATFEVVHEPYGKRFTCPKCTEFFLDGHCELEISRWVEVYRSEMREKLRAAAKQATAEGRLFVIREPKTSELGGDGNGVARTRLIAESVPLKRE